MGGLHNLNEERLRRFLTLSLALFMGASLFYVCFRYVLPWCLPFLLALLIATLLEPVVLYLRRKLHFQRGFSALILTLTLLFLLGGLLSLCGSLLSPQLLRLAGAQESYLRDALIYLRIYLAGLMFTVIYNNAAGILRALGRADIPFRILVVSCGMNIALDLLFVSAFDMGIAGVGVATVLSQDV